MARKRFSSEQIVTKLRQIEVLLAQGNDPPPEKWSRLNVSPRPVLATGDQAKCLGNGSLQSRSLAS